MVFEKSSETTKSQESDSSQVYGALSSQMMKGALCMYVCSSKQSAPVVQALHAIYDCYHSGAELYARSSIVDWNRISALDFSQNSSLRTGWLEYLRLSVQICVCPELYDYQDSSNIKKWVFK